MANEGNLKPWKPGQSGNPNGRPKVRTFEEDVRAVLAEEFPESQDLTQQQLARVFVTMMLSKNMTAIKAFMDRDWPAVNLHDLRVPGADPAELEDAIDAFLAKRGSSGADAEPAARRANGHGGVAP